MAQYQDLFGFDRYAQAQDMARQWQRQKQQDDMTLAQMQETQRRNALAEKYALEDRQRETDIRNAMSQPIQTGGPLRDMQEYQQVGSRQPTREEYGQRLMGLGEYEQGLKLMPEPVKPENYTLTPGAMRFGPNNQVVASAPVAEKPPTYREWGYGQIKDTTTGETFKVPTAPQSTSSTTMPKPPSGYRYTQSGELEAIPGGPAAQKQLVNAQTLADGAAAIDYTSDAIDRLLNHPGRKAATGMSSILDPRNYAPGTDAYDFNAELESFDAKLFLSNIQQMKGMGALSNAEGAKVSAAAGAIKPGMSEKAFETNLRIIQNELAKAKARKETGSFLPTVENKEQTRQTNIQNNVQKLSDADLLKALGGK